MLLTLSGCALAGTLGKDGADGLSAYELAVKYGFEGTEKEWIASLQGNDAPGTIPVIGDNGNWWIDGKDTDYVQALKDVGAECHLPVIDLYYELGINRQNRLDYFSQKDGTHPNAIGRQAMAKLMAEKIF